MEMQYISKNNSQPLLEPNSSFPIMYNQNKIKYNSL